MAPASKRMSAEEKRTTILGIFHNLKDVYIEKEIISLATKAGVSQGAILDTLEALIDDGLVERKKIAGSNFMYSFPAAEDRKLQTKFEEMVDKQAAGKRKLTEAQSALTLAGVGREDVDGQRSVKMAKIKELEAEKILLGQELEVLKENDPQVLADLQKELRMTKEAAERWTDNIYACKSYLTKKRGLDGKEADKMIGITETFDYPEDKIEKPKGKPKQLVQKRGALGAK